MLLVGVVVSETSGKVIGLVVVKGVVVVGGSSAFWVICASAEHATPGWEHISVILCGNDAVVLDSVAAAPDWSTRGTRRYSRDQYLLRL